MDAWEYSVSFILLYLCGLAYFSWNKKTESDGYILGGRSLGFWHVYGSVISYMRAGSNLVFWFAFVSLMGFGSLWILISFYTAFIIMTFLAERARRLSLDNGHITFTDLIAHQQGALMALWINIFSVYVILILVVSQLFIAGAVLSGLLQISVVAATILCAFTVGVYVVLGGFLSVVRTDFYQSLVIIFISLLGVAFLDWPSGAAFHHEITSPNWDMVIGFGIIGFVVPASTDMWQRFFAVKRENIIVPATLLALLTDIIIVVGLILFIQYVISHIAPQTGEVFFSFFQNQNDFPLATALFGVFIVSAILSTMDNQIFNLASITSKNILKIDSSHDRKKFVWVLRISAALSLLIFAIMALTISDIMQWIINTYAYVGVITPFIFYGVLKKAWSDKFLALGVLISSVAHWYMYALSLYTNMEWYAASYGISAAFVLVDIIMGWKAVHKTT